VVTDQVGCPTWTGHLAGALVELAEHPQETGIHHIAGAGACSWNELALEVFERAGIDCRVLPASSEQFVRPAKRPAYSVLGTERTHPLVLPRWQDGVAEYVATRVTA
jgi:dTDP-4-dehydrorhamnose reductase